MKTIGITGGVGAGKTAILAYIEKQYNCKVLLADKVANQLKQQGNSCYNQLVKLMGTSILNDENDIDNNKMAELIFEDTDILAKVNLIIHPSVKAYIKKELEKERLEGFIDYFFVEAALLIEEQYNLVLDEIWYIYVKESIRRERLIKGRGYSNEKINAIFLKQLSDDEFRNYCVTIIDNSYGLENSYMQIREKLEAI